LVPVLFSGVKTACAWSDHSPPPSADMSSWRGKEQLCLLFAMNERRVEVETQATGRSFNVLLWKEDPWVRRRLHPGSEETPVPEWNPNTVAHPAVSRHCHSSKVYCQIQKQDINLHTRIDGLHQYAMSPTFYGYCASHFRHVCLCVYDINWIWWISN
jgi:hypothetical protein